MRHTYEKQIMVVDIVVGGVTVQDLDVFDFLLVFRVGSAVDIILVRCWGRRYDRAHDSVLVLHRGSRVDPVKLNKKFQMVSTTDDRRASVCYIYIYTCRRRSCRQRGAMGAFARNQSLGQWFLHTSPDDSEWRQSPWETP
jgi:hypothetical protein